VARKRRLLPDDAAPGEEAALVYYLRDDDQKIGLAWWSFCLSCADHKPAFSRQLEQLAARAGRPVTHVDGIRVALRFWELSMASDPAFAERWRSDRKSIAEPEGELDWLIDQLAEQEWREFLKEHHTPEQEKQGELWGAGFKAKFGFTLKELAEEKGLTVDQAGTLLVRAGIVHEITGIVLAFMMWAAAPRDHKFIALADQAARRN
jgi:hypothetical protein